MRVFGSPSNVAGWAGRSLTPTVSSALASGSAYGCGSNHYHCPDIAFGSSPPFSALETEKPTPIGGGGGQGGSEGCVCRP